MTLLAWHGKFEKHKALKKEINEKSNACSVVSKKMVKFLLFRRWGKNRTNACWVMLLVLIIGIQDAVRNGCHDLTILCPNLSDIAVISVKNVDYRCIIHNISKSEAINLLENSVLEDRGYIQKILWHSFGLAW